MKSIDNTLDAVRKALAYETLHNSEFSAYCDQYEMPEQRRVHILAIMVQLKQALCEHGKGLFYPQATSLNAGKPDTENTEYHFRIPRHELSEDHDFQAVYDSRAVRDHLTAALQEISGENFYIAGLYYTINESDNPPKVKIIDGVSYALHLQYLEGSLFYRTLNSKYHIPIPGTSCD